MNEHGADALMLAIYNGRTFDVGELLRQGADVHAIDDRRWTALMYATDRGALASVVELVHAGAAIEAFDDLGRTPLLVASGFGHRDVVSFLLASGANVQAQAVSGVTPLMAAARQGHPDIVTQLVAAGAAVDAACDRGDTALMYAVLTRQWAVVELLVELGADLQAANDQGVTPASALTDAVHSMPLHAPDADGLLPLMAAARAGHCTLIRFMHAAGAPLDAGGDAALMHAARAGQWKAMDILRELGADAYAADALGVDPLSAALHKWREFGVAIDARTAAGETTLMYAQHDDWASLLEALICAAMEGPAAAKPQYAAPADAMAMQFPEVLLPEAGPEVL